MLLLLLRQADIVIDLNAAESVIIYWVLSLIIVFLLGYMLAHAHWTTRMHGRMPGKGEGGPRRGPPVLPK